MAASPSARSAARVSSAPSTRRSASWTRWQRRAYSAAVSCAIAGVAPALLVRIRPAARSARSAVSADEAAVASRMARRKVDVVSTAGSRAEDAVVEEAGGADEDGHGEDGG